MSDNLRDHLDRPLHDLRISVTDHCNFRCVYCMPRSAFGHGYPFLPREEILTYEEIIRIARIFVSLGVGKIRLTGGEPLLRKDIEHLIEPLAQLPGVELTLTTNGALLAARARGLRDAGLQRITVSLDALDDAVFRRMNDADYPVGKVLAGIDAAAACGLSPVKINMVVKRGTNDHEILPMARHFRGSGHVLRFIEYMDVGNTNAWNMAEVLPSAEVIRRVASEFAVEPVEPNYTGEVAERWRYRDGSGEIGVISSVTQAFCSGCSRVRLATNGQLYTCLFATAGHDLRKLIRGGADDKQLRTAITAIWMARHDRYSELRQADIPITHKIEMSYIGG